jgi:hypothetical protein
MYFKQLSASAKWMIACRKFFGRCMLMIVSHPFRFVKYIIPNKVRTRFFRFPAVSRVPARRAISPAANSLSLRALAEGQEEGRLNGAIFISRS